MAKHTRIVNTVDGQEITEAVDETSPAKAIVGSAITVVVAFLSPLVVALDDNVITPTEWLTATVGALVSAGLVFGGVYVTTNRPKA